MKRRWQRWVDFTSARERGTTLAAFRIAVGTVIVATLLSAWQSDVVSLLWIDRAHGGMLEAPDTYWLLELCGGTRPAVVWTFFAAALATGIAMVAGIGGRWTILAAGLLYRSLSTVGNISGGYDLMIANAVWLLFLGQATATLSLDCYLRERRWISERLISAWPRRFAIGQLVLVYTATGLQKTSSSWSADEGYSAMYLFLQEPTWTRFDMTWLADVYPLTQIATFTVWYFEALAPLLLVVLYLRLTRDRGGRLRRASNRFDLRKPWAVYGLGMHLGIAALMNMGPFSWISMSYYLCLLTPDELERWARRWWRRVAAKLRRTNAGSRPAEAEGSP